MAYSPSPGMSPQELIAWMQQLQMQGPAAGSQPIPPQLAMQGQPSPPVAQNAPVAQDAQQRKPGLLDRLVSTIFPTPEGMLSPEDQEAYTRSGLFNLGARLSQASGPQPGRVGVMQALGQAIGGASPDMLKMAGGMAGYRKAQQQEQARREIFAKYPEKQGETLEQRGNRLMSIFNELVRIGDTEMAGKVSEVLKSLGLGSQDRRRGGHIDLGDRVMLTDPTGMPVMGPDGMPITFPKGQAPETARQRSAQDLSERRIELQAMSQLGGRYQQWVKPWVAGKQAIGRAVAWKQEAIDGSSPAQVQFLYAFIATLDNSVVREGEARMLGDASSWKAQASKWLDKTHRGQVMPREVVQQMIDILDSVDQDLRARFDRLRKEYVDLGATYGVPASAFPDMNAIMESVPRDGASAPGSGGGSPLFDRYRTTTDSTRYTF